MPPHFPAAYFPDSVWKGTSINKEHRYDFVDPNPEDYNRIAAEIIALETYLTTPFPYADFEIDAVAPPWSEGRVFYDSEEKTFSVYNNEPDVTLQLGQEMYIRATNKTGVEIVNGSLCYVDGAQGNRPTVTLAKADSPSTARVLCIATHSVDDNDTGFFTVFGLVRGLKTDTYSEGNTLYLSDTVAGAFTDVMPTAPSFPIKIGVVTRSNAEEGAVLITIGPTDVVSTIVILDLDINTNLDVGGDLLFNGVGSGLAFGEIFVKDNVVTTSVISSSHTQVTVFTNNGETNNSTSDFTENHIEITKAGRYMVNCSVSVLNSAGAGHLIHVELFKNDGAVDFDNVHAHRTLSAGSDKGSISLSGIISVEVGDTLELWTSSDSGTAKDVTFEDVTLTVIQVGGN
jgi:hypothetical protein